MDDAAMMRVREGVAHLQKHLDTAFDAIDRSRWTSAEPIVERDTLNELHREVRNAVRIDRELVHGHDVRMLELPRNLSLGNERVAIKRCTDGVLVETLQGH